MNPIKLDELAEKECQIVALRQEIRFHLASKKVLEAERDRLQIEVDNLRKAVGALNQGLKSLVK